MRDQELGARLEQIAADIRWLVAREVRRDQEAEAALARERHIRQELAAVSASGAGALVRLEAEMAALDPTPTDNHTPVAAAETSAS
jgi:hypothetical protein